MALFVVLMGLSPTEYLNLTLIEREQLVEVYEKSQKARNGL
jgi:hypothetical protein